MEKDRFISYIQFEKRYSPHTVQAYQSDLDQFFLFVGNQYGDTAIEQINHLMIRSWLMGLIEEKISARSVNRKLTTLKSFFKFLLREGVVENNPMRKVISPKTPKRLPVFFEKEKMETLFTNANFGEGFPGLRNKIILELLYSTGMRLSELIRLKDADIDFHHSALKVLGKRNKERLIPFSPKLANLLQEYGKEKLLYIYRCQNAILDEGEPGGQISSVDKSSQCEFLIITDSCTPAYPKFIYRVVTSYLGEITTKMKKSPHTLRHTFATHLLNNGAELNAVKELLGHASLSATQVYTHNTIDKLKKIYQQAHPKA